jgi:hypothetical protein
MLRIFAHFFSVVFHPLFVLMYIALVLLWTNPFSFGWRHVSQADTFLIILGMTTITLPALAILMMRLLGWVKTFDLESRHERIAPYIVAGIMYLSLYLHLVRAGTFPVSIRVAVLGTLIGLWSCFLMNNFIKVSVHGLGMGGLVAMVGLTKTTFGGDQAQIGLGGGANLILPLDILFYASVIIAGLVCTSRLILKAHEPREVYLGFTTGVVSIGVACLVLM